jgi:hypothetical protein
MKRVLLLAAAICVASPLAARAGDEFRQASFQATRDAVYAAMLEAASEGWVVKTASKDSCLVSFTNKPSWRSLRRLTISATCVDADGVTRLIVNDDNNGAHGQGRAERKKFLAALTKKLRPEPAQTSSR